MTTQTEWVAKRFPWRLQQEKQLTKIRELVESTNKVTALIVQSVLLEYAELHPEVTSFTFEAGFEYDDEAGYFWTPTFYAIKEDGTGVGDEDFDDDFYDLLREEGMNEEECILVFNSASSYKGEITVAELREAWQL